MREKLIGIVPSTRPDRLMDLFISLMLSSDNFPIYVLAQGYSEQQRDFIERVKPSFVTVFFCDKVNYMGVPGITQRLIDMCPDSDYIYMFDDDFIFTSHSLQNIKTALNEVELIEGVGAISFLAKNHNNEHLELIEASNSKLLSFVSSSSIPMLWKNGGILINRCNMLKLDPKMLYSEDCAYFIDIFLKGFAVMSCRSDIEHLTFIHENKYKKSDEGAYWKVSHHLANKLAVNWWDCHYMKPFVIDGVLQVVDEENKDCFEITKKFTEIHTKNLKAGMVL